MTEPSKYLLDHLAFEFLESVVATAKEELGQMHPEELRQVSIITLAALNVKVANSLQAMLGEYADCSPTKYLDKFVLDVQNKMYEMRNRYVAAKSKEKPNMITTGIVSLQ